jgi:hypothetical protein
MAALSHLEAWQIVADAWRDEHGRSPTYKEALYTQAVALLETGYGRAGQFRALADRGLHNWGALERSRNADGSCPEGTAPGTDLGKVCFFVYPTDRAAARAFIRTLTKRHWPTIEAMRGTPEDVARAMRVPPAYYGGTSGTEADRVAAYAAAIRGGASQIASQVPSTVPGSTGGLLVGGALAVLAGVVLWRHVR